MKGIRARVDVLNEDEIQLIHRNSLALLSGTGVKVPSAEVLDLAESAGARVDRGNSVARIPRETMEALISGVRKAKGQKNGTPDADFLEPLQGKISTQVHVVDYRAGTRRYGTLADVGDGIALVDRLENFPRSMAVAVPHDVPAGLSDILSFREIFAYSRKPGGTYILGPASAGFILDMAEAAGKEVEYLFESVSPLSFRKETLEIGLQFARRGQALAMAPMVMAGATAPVTLAGMLTMQNAEVLASLFLIHALSGIGKPLPGKPAGSFAREYGSAVLDDELVYVHARAGDLVHGFGHECHEKPQFVRHTPQYPLCEDYGVTRLFERDEIEFDFKLGGAHFVMVVFDGNARGDHRVDGAVAQKPVAVFGREAMVALGQAEAGRIFPVFADAFGAFDEIIRMPDRGGVVCVIENVEFQFHEHFRVIADTAPAQPLESFAGYDAGILIEWLAIRGMHIAECVEDAESVLFLDKSRFHIRRGHHIGCMHLRVSEIGCVETDAFFKHFFADIGGRQAHRADLAGDIHDKKGEVVEVGHIARPNRQLHSGLLGWSF